LLTDLDLRLDDRARDATVANLAQSSANLERMSLAGAESVEATRGMPKPSQKAFWRRLLELMIPKPTIRVGNRAYETSCTVHEEPHLRNPWPL